MGHTSYSTEVRATRAADRGYQTKAREEIFTQRQVHDSMSPRGISLREARDSEAHPQTLPIILGLDVTGSMGVIPHELIKTGLPTLMSGLIRTGLADATLCFTAIGDHKTDRGPLQVGQFESGDEELDMWLERTWLEGNGGGQNSESYSLAWLFASRLVQTDAWDKRQQKGFLITVGDECNHPSLPKSALRDMFGDEIAAGMFDGDVIQSTELLAQTQEKWHVYHINCNHGSLRNGPFWSGILGDHLIEVSDHRMIPEVIGRIILDHPEVPGSFDLDLFNSPEPVGERAMEV